MVLKIQKFFSPVFSTSIILVSFMAVACLPFGTGTFLDVNQQPGTEKPETPAQSAYQFVGDQTDLEMHRGLPVGFTQEGYPFRGSPDAPFTLVDFSDYLCPFCGRHFDQALPALPQTYGAPDMVSFVFPDLPLTSLYPAGHSAAFYAREQEVF